MGEERKKKSGVSGPVLFAVIGLIVALPILYVLSSGPATWLYDHGYVSTGTLERIYLPLGWMNERCKPLENFQIWYCSFFRTLPPPMPTDEMMSNF